MIVTPGFFNHYKTSALVELTKDPSSPLCVQQLWAHCQESHRWEFPDMTPKQLASICRWGERQPACHVALVRAGFVDKLKPKGFAAHDWDEYNAKLIANWENGKNGGRPKNSEKGNKDGQTEKPMGSGGITHTEPIDQTDRPEGIERKTRPEASPSSTRTADAGMGSGSFVSGVGLDGLVAGIASKVKALPFTPPTLEQVENTLRMAFAGAERYAESFHKTMTNQGWRDKERKPLTCWQSVAKHYASSAAMKAMKAKP